MCCGNLSGNRSVLRFYCGPKSTAAVLTLISVVVYPLVSSSYNRRMALTQMSSDCSIHRTSLFNKIELPLLIFDMPFNVLDFFGEALLQPT